MGSLTSDHPAATSGWFGLWNLSPQPADFLFGLLQDLRLSTFSAGVRRELVLSDVPGFVTPPVPENLVVEIRAGRVNEVVFTYEPEVEQLSPLEESSESSSFGSPNNIGIANDLSDPDGDGFTNEEEFLREQARWTIFRLKLSQFLPDKRPCASRPALTQRAVRSRAVRGGFISWSGLSVPQHRGSMWIKWDLSSPMSRLRTDWKWRIRVLRLRGLSIE